MLAALILATVLDIALATLLIMVSGLIFGGGPEGANGETTAVILWILGLAGCIATPIAGFVCWVRGRAGWGVLFAIVPPIVGACFLAL